MSKATEEFVQQVTAPPQLHIPAEILDTPDPDHPTVSADSQPLLELDLTSLPQGKRDVRSTACAEASTREGPAARAAWLADAFALVKAAVAYRRGILEHCASCDGLERQTRELHTPLALLLYFKTDSKPRLA